tara:strand:- start:219 stop:614 length:396 start_codon:yes stop_codon:yes gene_type:complete
MNSNNYNSGIELNVSIVSIISAIYQHIPYDRHTCINHEKYYDVIDYTDGTYRGELPNSGYVMPTEEAEQRCKYLHDKYRNIETKFGLVRARDLLAPIKKETYISDAAVRWANRNPFSVKEMREFQRSLWGW